MGAPAVAMAAWAAKDLKRHPGSSVLTGLALASLVGVMATVLLLVEAWSGTATLLLQEGPSLVVRRVDPGGWRPLPAAAAVRAATGVVGVLEARPRVWGVVAGPEGAVTVQGMGDRAAGKLAAAGVPVPGPGQAALGAGVSRDAGSTTITLEGTGRRTLEVIAVLDDAVALGFHDVVLVPEPDARILLGLGDDLASDLAVDVFHEAEEQAIIPDLAEAFPWPVRIITRSDAVGAAVAVLARQGGLVTVLLLPAVLAMVLVVTTVLRSRAGSRREIGLYKALGWGTGDLVGLQLAKSLLVGIPAVLLGLAVAWGLVFRPGITWPGSLLLGWPMAPPPLILDTGGAAVVALSVAAVVLVPWILASILPAVRSATADPDELVRGGD